MVNSAISNTRVEGRLDMTSYSFSGVLLRLSQHRQGCRAVGAAARRHSASIDRPSRLEGERDDSLPRRRVKSGAMQPETTIYLLRHAHAEWREDEGRPLSSDGIKAAHVVTKRLSGRAIAAIRGLAVVRTVAERHVGSEVVLATHGNLLALMLNALDRKFAYEFWRRLSFPDVYQLTLVGTELRRVERVWDAA